MKLQLEVVFSHGYPKQTNDEDMTIRGQVAMEGWKGETADDRVTDKEWTRREEWKERPLE